MPVRARPPILKTPLGGGGELEFTKAQNPTSNGISNPHFSVAGPPHCPGHPTASAPHTPQAPLHPKTEPPSLASQGCSQPLPSTPPPALKDPGEDSTSPQWAPSQSSLPTVTQAAQSTPAVASGTASAFSSQAGCLEGSQWRPPARPRSNPKPTPCTGGVLAQWPQTRAESQLREPRPYTGPVAGTVPAWGADAPAWLPC